MVREENGIGRLNRLFLRRGFTGLALKIAQDLPRLADNSSESMRF